MNDSHTSPVDHKISKTAYDFSFHTLNEHAEINLSDFRGKVILVVNTASRCGFTSQYADLEMLYRTYKDQGLVVVGVPSNDFGQQEPGTEADIADFCQRNYGVSFVMVKKEKVSGPNAHPFYQWVRTYAAAPKWNFYKYLINRRGSVINYFYSMTSPQSTRLKKAIEKALCDHTGDCA